MNFRPVLVGVTMLFFCSIPLLANGAPGSPADDAFWVAHWAKPKVNVGAPEERAFYDNVREVEFAHDRFDHDLDEDTLNTDVQWLKDHPSVRFFIEGYSSVTGTEAYNLRLSGYRADWVKEVLLRKGVAADQILIAVPWGQLYPACLDRTEECHATNRVVRFAYYRK